MEDTKESSLPSNSSQAVQPQIPVGKYVDRFGILVPLETKRPLSEGEQKQLHLLKIRDQERELKWIHMLKDWDSFFASNPRKVKSRIRKGIPDSVRALIWFKISGAQQKLEENPGVYEAMLRQHSQFADTINRDIARTFPNHVLFRDGPKAGKSRGRDSLRNVLNAYACYDKHVGYCQGMGFVVGILLMYMNEEDTFWVLYCLLRDRKYNLYGLYSPGFPLLNQYFFQLGRLQETGWPRLFVHCQRESVMHALYATDWFLCLFSYDMNLESILRIWDIMINEGPKIIFKTALFFWSYQKAEMLATDFQGIVEILKQVEHDELVDNPDKFIEAVLNVNLSRKELAKLENEYHEELIAARLRLHRNENKQNPV